MNEMYQCINRNARPNNNQLLTRSNNNLLQTCRLLTKNTVQMSSEGAFNIEILYMSIVHRVL